MPGTGDLWLILRNQYIINLRITAKDTRVHEPNYLSITRETLDAKIRHLSGGAWRVAKKEREVKWLVLYDRNYRPPTRT